MCHRKQNPLIETVRFEGEVCTYSVTIFNYHENASQTFTSIRFLILFYTDNELPSTRQITVKKVNTMGVFYRSMNFCVRWKYTCSVIPSVNTGNLFGKNTEQQLMKIQ